MSLRYPEENEPTFYTNTSLNGPELEHTKLNEATINAFMDIREFEKDLENEPGIVGNVYRFEASGEELSVLIHDQFDTKSTLKKRAAGLEQINNITALHLFNLMKIYENLSNDRKASSGSSRQISDSDVAAIMSEIIIKDLVARNSSCIKYYEQAGCVDGCDEYDEDFINELRQEILDDLTEVSDEDQDIFGTTNPETIAKRKLSNTIASILAIENERILDHLPEDGSYKDFDFKESLPKILTGIGQVAIGTAIGATIALFIANRKK